MTYIYSRVCSLKYTAVKHNNYLPRGLLIKVLGEKQSISVDAAGADTEYLVMTRDKQSLSRVTKSSGVKKLSRLEDENLLKNRNMTLIKASEDTVEDLLLDEDVLYIEPNISLKAQSEKNESGIDSEVVKRNTEKLIEEKKKVINTNTDVTGLQWNLEAIHWKHNQMGDRPVKIAVLDSGVNYDEDIQIAEDIRIRDEDKDISARYIDICGHGTGVAGIIAAQKNTIGITGIASGAKVYSIKVLDDKDTGKLSDIVAGIYAAIENDCDIINMSFGTSSHSDILHEAVRDASNAGILLVASAGNHKGSVLYPAVFPEVLGVGSTDAKGKWITGTAKGDAWADC